MSSLQIMIYPLGLAVTLVGVGLLLQILRRRRFGALVVVVGLFWLWTWSTPVFSDLLRRSLEQRYVEVPVEEVPQAAVIVVLGGAMQHDQHQPYPGLSRAADRYWHAARLFHADRAERVILSGGRTPGRGPGMTEAEAAAVLMRDLGVPDAALMLETGALTTRENAVNVARMMAERDLRTLLLVTSALHMRRSVAAFRGAGLDPIPVATDFEVRPASNRALRRWLPNASALASSSRAFHEYVGFWYYRARGWL